MWKWNKQKMFYAYVFRGLYTYMWFTVQGLMDDTCTPVSFSSWFIRHSTTNHHSGSALCTLCHNKSVHTIALNYDITVCLKKLWDGSLGLLWFCGRRSFWSFTQKYLLGRLVTKAKRCLCTLFELLWHKFVHIHAIFVLCVCGTCRKGQPDNVDVHLLI